MEPTKEQKEILNFVANERGSLKINAYAGTGKSTSLKMITEALFDKSFLYVAFNKSVADEAKKKFPPNCKVFTVHGLALTQSRPLLGENFFDRLKMRWRMSDYIARYKLKTKLRPFITSNFNEYDYLNIITTILSRFRISDSDDFESFAKSSLGRGGYASVAHGNNTLQSLIVEIAKDVWQEEIDPKGKSPVTHGTYLKVWELSNPEIKDIDFILFDESQDANRVMLSVINKSRGPRKIFVGDVAQSIYGWNGAVNALSKVDSESELYLTQSWRFGDAIAAKANELLKFLQQDSHVPLKGTESIKSMVGFIDERKQYARIFRTNAAMAEFALGAIDSGKVVYVEGGVKDLCNDLLDLHYLNTGNTKSRPKTSKYKPYRFINEVLKEAKYDPMIKRDLQFVNKHKENTPELMEVLKNSVVDKRSLRRCNIICTTAHKSKGLEFDQVVLAEDFKLFSEEAASKEDEIYFHPQLGFANVSTEEVNLLYVALTRAKNNLKLMQGFEDYVKTIQKKTTGTEVQVQRKSSSRNKFRKNGRNS